MRVLIIGKNSQLGSSFDRLIGTDSETSNHLEGGEFVFTGRKELNLENNSAIDNYFNSVKRFDIIINCAAYTAVDKAEDEPDLANQINHLSVRRLAEISKNQQAKLIHISTDYVFDGMSSKPYTETDEVNPVNVYGRTKLHGERAIQEVMPVNATIIRTSWLYSEYGNNFVKTMLKIGQERKEINVVNDQIGSPTYAFDLAKIILKIISDKEYQNQDHLTEVYHYSNQNELSWYDFAKDIFRVAGIDCQVNPVMTEQYSTTARRPRNTLMSKDKIIDRFGISLRKYNILPTIQHHEWKK